MMDPLAYHLDWAPVETPRRGWKSMDPGWPMAGVVWRCAL